jgi:hypothetical protein
MIFLNGHNSVKETYALTSPRVKTLNEGFTTIGTPFHFDPTIKNDTGTLISETNMALWWICQHGLASFEHQVRYTHQE